MRNISCVCVWARSVYMHRLSHARSSTCNSLNPLPFFSRLSFQLEIVLETNKLEANIYLSVNDFISCFL